MLAGLLIDLDSRDALAMELKQRLIEGASRTDIMNEAMAKGMISLRMDGLDKVRQGITTYEEVLRVTR